MPYCELKWSAFGRELQIEVFEVSGEIGLKLVDGLGVRGAVLFPRRIWVRWVPAVYEKNLPQAGIIRG